MRNWIYRMLEPLIEVAITNRLLMFHGVLVERGQIKPLPEPEPEQEED